MNKAIQVNLLIGFLLTCSCQHKHSIEQKPSSKELEPDTVSIDLEHIVWDRFSPTWYRAGVDFMERRGFEVVPAHDSLKIPEQFWVNSCEGRTFRFTGQFFEEAQPYGYPKKDYLARTLKYTGIEYLPYGREEASLVLNSYKAYKKILDLDHRGRNAQDYIQIIGCPDDTLDYYFFHVSVKASNGEYLRISKKNGVVELRDKYTNEYKPFRP